MGTIKRLKVVAVLLALAAGLTAIPDRGAADTEEVLRLELTGETGGLRIVNPASAPITVARKILVERKRKSDDGWDEVHTDFNAVSECADLSTSSVPVEIAANSALTAVPWKGFSCSGQCWMDCDKNVYSGPGIFRFAVTKLPEMKRFISPEFALPPAPYR